MATTSKKPGSTRKMSTNGRKTTPTRKKKTTGKTTAAVSKKSTAGGPKKKSTTATRKKTAGRKKTTSLKKTPGRKKSTRKYGAGASESVRKEMEEYKGGSARSGRSGAKVKSRKQAIAIGLSEARASGKKVPPNPNRSTRKKSN